MYANQVVGFNSVFQSDGGVAGVHEKEEPFDLEGGKEYFLIVRQHPNETKQHVRNRDGITAVTSAAALWWFALGTKWLGKALSLCCGVAGCPDCAVARVPKSVPRQRCSAAETTRQH